MKSLVAVGISMLCLLYSFPNLHAEGNLIFSDTYFSKEIDSGDHFPEIDEEIYTTYSGILFKRYKKDGDKEKTLRCLFDAKTGQLISAHVERMRDGELYESVDVEVDGKYILYSRVGEKTEAKKIKRKNADLISVPDALHFSIGNLNIGRGEKKDIMMINWDGGSLMFTIKAGKEDVWIDGNRYREISCTPNLPFFAQALVQWGNTYWYPVDSRYMALFRGKQGPFDKPIEIWRAHTGKVELAQ